MAQTGRHRTMDVLDSIFRLRTAAVAALVFTLCAAAARASIVPLPGGTAPVVRVAVRDGLVTVRTWNRSDVQVQGDHVEQARAFSAQAVARALRGDVPIFATKVQTRSGAVALPAESFPLGSLPDGDHPGVAVRADGNVVVTVPSATSLMLLNANRGGILVRGYHGTLVARLHNGPIMLQNFSGSAYLESARGRIFVNDSMLDRMRARTAIGNIVFNNCTAREIEVSSVDGAVVYDNGTFAPGLARFESQNGPVAVGVAGGNVQIGAHSNGGRIFTDFSRATVNGNGSDARAVVGDGGPVVTVASGSTVYLYDGSLARHRNAGFAWHQLRVRIPRLQKKLP